MHDLTPRFDPGPDQPKTTEALLSELAARLLRLPFEGRTHGLHIRALQLKRRLDQLEPSGGAEVERRAAHESIIALRDDMIALGRSGR